MKKKIFTLFTALTLSAGALFASTTAVDGIYYDFYDANQTATVTFLGDYPGEYDAYTGDVVIPATVTYGGNTYSVTSIGDDAFYDCSGLTSVTIGNSVTSIGSSAFSGCNSLTSVTIPNSVTSIGRSAFQWCRGLTSVTIPNSVTSIGDWMFAYCSGLTSIVVESGNTTYDSRNGCNAIIETATNTLVVGCQSTIIPNSVTSIGDYAFSGCSGLTSVTIPNSVTSIGMYAFDGCSGLTSVTIPNSVTSIGGRAFYGCSGLTSVVWNAKNCANFSRSDYAPFYYIASQITSFTFGSEVEHIPAYLCYRMKNLTSVTIPNSVTSIGDVAFGGCRGLTSVTIPNSVTSISSYTFSSVPNIVYSGTATGSPWGARSVNGYVEGYLVYESEAKTQLLACFSAATGEIIIPNSVTSIGYYAFSDCSGLTSVTIPNSVTSIGESAFYNVPNIVYSGTATGSPWGARSVNGYVEGYLVYESEAKTQLLACSSAATGEIIIPNSVTSIGESAFDGCSGLTSITIPNSVTSIGVYAFRDCSGLTSVVWNAKNCADFSSDSYAPFYDYNIKSPITSFTFGSEVEHIPAYLCYGMENLTSVTIPNSVTSIGVYAFKECTNLINIVCYAAEPPSCGASVFANYNASLNVPCSSLEAYKADAVWGSFNNISCIGSTVGLEQIELAGLYTQAGRIVCEGEFRIYDLLGRDVTRLNGSLSGVYVVKTANAAVKVVVK